MQHLRIDAFEKEDPEAAAHWAANLAVLKKKCYADDEIKACQVLSQESMYMAAKYYQMWDQTLSMWNAQNAAPSDMSADMLGAGAGAAGAAPASLKSLDVAQASVFPTALLASSSSGSSVLSAALGGVSAILSASGSFAVGADSLNASTGKREDFEKVRAFL